MRMFHWGRACLAGAVVASAAASAAASPALARSAGATAALGSCWLNHPSFGLGEDTSATDYITRWRAGSVQTIIQGAVPKARYWSITIYHAKKGKMITLYDQQIASHGGTFTVTIGGPRPADHSTYVDPTAGGGDSSGYLFLRVYQRSGAAPAQPTVTYKGALTPSLMSCGAVTSSLSADLQKASKIKATLGESKKNKLWPNHVSPYSVWSTTVNPAQTVPASDVTQVPLITQVADPNVVYHVIFFNLAHGDLVFYGTMPGISSAAPAHGVRYVSLCAYPNDESHTPLACLADKSIKTDAHGHFELVVSPDQPSDTNNWLNPGSSDSAQVGAIILRWVLPSGGAKANFCLPALTYRQPGDTTVPPLPAGC